MRATKASLRLTVLIGMTALGTAGAAAQQAREDPQLTVQLIDAKGDPVGEVQIKQLAHGALFIAELEGLPPDGHGFHVHEHGACEPPDFQSAGGHYSPLGHEHGLDNPAGYHAGDLPNIHVMEDGTAKAEFFARQLALTDDPGQLADSDPFAVRDQGPFVLLDDDGSALMIHRDPDDYEAEPPDSTGPRIACGVVERG